MFAEWNVMSFEIPTSQALQILMNILESLSVWRAASISCCLRVFSNFKDFPDSFGKVIVDKNMAQLLPCISEAYSSVWLINLGVEGFVKWILGSSCIRPVSLFLLKRKKRFSCFRIGTSLESGVYGNMFKQLIQ